MRRLLTFAVAALIGIVWLADRRAQTREPPFTAEYVHAGGIELRAAVGGAGKPAIVLLHGFAESATAWRTVASGLAGDFRVVAFDLPGHGLSQKPLSGYTVEDMGTTIARGIELTAGTGVVLVGHSMGGAVAAWVAASRPELVGRLVLIDAAGIAGPVLSSSSDLPPAALAALFGAGAAIRGPHDPEWLLEPRGDVSYQPSADPAYYDALEAILREFDFVGLDSVITEVRQPTLLVWGRHDRLTPVANAERMAELLPNSRLVIIEDALHRPHTTHPSEVLALIRQFALGEEIVSGQ